MRDTLKTKAKEVPYNSTKQCSYILQLIRTSLARDTPWSHLTLIAFMYLQHIQESEDENRPFGPDTYALVDENLGGIVAYISPDYLERMKEYIDTLVIS